MTELRPDKDSGRDRAEYSNSVPSNLLIAHGDERNEVANPPFAVITNGSTSNKVNVEKTNEFIIKFKTKIFAPWH